MDKTVIMDALRAGLHYRPEATEQMQFVEPESTATYLRVYLGAVAARLAYTTGCNISPLIRWIGDEATDEEIRDLYQRSI